MEEETIKTITIRENPYELLQLSEIIDKLEYFDEVVKTLKLEGEVIYRDYKIIYKKRDGRGKYLYIWYDDNSLPIMYYNKAEELCSDLGIALQSLRQNSSKEKSGKMVFRGVEGYVEMIENRISKEEVRLRKLEKSKKYSRDNKERISKMNKEKYRKKVGKMTYKKEKKEK